MRARRMSATHPSWNASGGSERRPDRIIADNTAFSSTPLVPEILVRLLKDDSPLWRSFRDARAEEVGPRPYWAFAWSGGQALARYVLDHPLTVRGRSVLDFGAGCGIASIAAAKAGARMVMASDTDPLAMRASWINARMNDVEVMCVGEDLIYTPNRGWDTVLAGDVWYDSRMYRHGLRWLRDLAGQGISVLVGDPGRAYSPSLGLERLEVYACRSVPDLEDENLREVHVYRLLPELPGHMTVSSEPKP